MIAAAITSFRGPAVVLLGLAALTYDSIDPDPAQVAGLEPVLDDPPTLVVVELATSYLCMNAIVSVSGFRIDDVTGPRDPRLPIGERFYVADVHRHHRFVCDCMDRCFLNPADVTVIAAAKDRAEAETILAWLRFAELPTRDSH